MAMQTGTSVPRGEDSRFHSFLIPRITYPLDLLQAHRLETKRREPMIGTALLHARGFSRPVLLALISALFCEPIWSQNPGREKWAGPFPEWESIISVYAEPAPGEPAKLLCPAVTNPDGVPGMGNRELEFSHAAVMPTGTFAGWVLLWRKEIETDPLNLLAFCKPTCAQNTTVIWAFNPANPNVLTPIRQEDYPPLTSNLFCGGVSWDRLGQLVIAGGTPAGCDGDTNITFPAEAYRFRPTALAFVEVEGESFAYSKAPFKQQGDMAIERYYPSVIPLIQRASEQPNHVGGAGLLMDGGLNLVAGGPPLLQEGSPASASPQGNEFWEVLEAHNTGKILWEDPFVPVNPAQPDPTYTVPNNSNAPHWDPVVKPAHATYEPYTRKPLTPISAFPDRVFDSYPRMFQMTGGDILVCGDVDTAASYSLGNVGATWVIKPKYDNDGGLTSWELWNGPQGADPDAGPWRDSFYDMAMLFQRTLSNGQTEYRVLLFGGSRDEAEGGNNWIVNDEVWEFSPADSSDPLVEGEWFRKVDLINPTTTAVPVFDDTTEYPEAFQRLYGNAVILPTGQVFLVGGTSTDDGEAEGHGKGDLSAMPPVPAVATAPVRPIIYDIGVDENDPGTVYEQDENLTNPAYPAFDGPLPRVYHSVAVLLADGRVLMAGGKRAVGTNGLPTTNPEQLGVNDPRYTGEIFSPPYLDLDLDDGNGFGSRPVITDAPNTMTMSDGTFMSPFVLEATRSSSRNIDKVVMLRPGAVTHHSDNDQRYVELFIESQVVLDPGPPEALMEITVRVPDRNDLPPGYYMLFVVETDGSSLEGHRVPSVGKFVRLKQ